MMSERRRVLGRGLSALLPGAERGMQQVRVAEIAPNPQQPRRDFDVASMAELVESVREHGILQPLIVSPLPASGEGGPRYRLVVGERRLRAAQIVGLVTVPALVRETESRDSLEIALVENLQRQDLNPVEEAQAYQELVSSFGLTQESVARRVGKSRPAVANSLRLLKLPPSVVEMVRDGRLSEGHARALLPLGEPERIVAAAERVVERQLSVRQTEAMVAALLATPPETTAAAPEAPDKATQALEDGLRRRLGTKVSLERGRRGGRLVIHFYSDEELDAIYQAIVGEDAAL